MEMSRRKFLGSTASAVIVAGTMAKGKVFGANNRLRGCVIGFHGQGKSHINDLLKDFTDDVQIAALCDVDSEVLANGINLVKEKTGKAPKGFSDMRKVFDKKNIDFVTIATPNHWHSLAAIWACQSGKDVYVEKPLSHSVWEGRQLVAAQDKYQRIVQHGTQNRSNPKIIWNMKQILEQGIIGDVVHSRGYVYKNGNRGSIGHGKPGDIPKNLDYTMWQGPAADEPYLVRDDGKGGLFVHYNWHWFWQWGNGEIGNQGVHQMDVASWAQQGKVPVKVQSMGGRFGLNDDGQTPNTQATTFTYADGTMTTFEVRNLGSYGELDEKEKCSNAVFGTKGYFQLQKGFFDYQDKPIEAPKPDSVQEGKEFVKFGRFIKAIRSRKKEDVPCDALIGHISCIHCHIGNIAYRLGRTLQFDPKTETFVNDNEANAMLKRTYRPGFEVPSLA